VRELRLNDRVSADRFVDDLWPIVAERYNVDILVMAVQPAYVFAPFS